MRDMIRRINYIVLSIIRENKLFEMKLFDIVICKTLICDTKNQLVLVGVNFIVTFPCFILKTPYYGSMTMDTIKTFLYQAVCAG